MSKSVGLIALCAVLLVAVFDPSLSAQVPNDDPVTTDNPAPPVVSDIIEAKAFTETFEHSEDVEASAFDEVALHAFVDGVVTTMMNEHQIAGVTVAIATSHDVLLLKGYGYANAETREPVDPARHLFRVASITKTFTATAIMQLVEQGLVDLDADIRTYLGDLDFDDSLGPVTVANLMTHTPGFEDRILNYYGENPSLVGKTTAEQLAAHAPQQIFAPGEVVAYSNYGFSLLGEIIAVVSGKPYTDYVKEEILTPLGMGQASLTVRRSEEADTPLRKDVALSHRLSNGWYTPQYFNQGLLSQSSAGDLDASAAAMIPYMQMHLRGGELNGVQILTPETAAKMQTPLIPSLGGPSGNAHGFWIVKMGEQTTLSHGGSTDDFLSMLTLAPDIGLGIFVSTNSASGRALTILPQRILMDYLGHQPVEEMRSPPGDFADRAHLYTGSYLDTRRNESRFDKIKALSDGTSDIYATDDGYLVAWGTRYVEVGQDTFASIIDGSRIIFTRDGDGPATRVSGKADRWALDRVGWMDNPHTLVKALGGLSITSVLAVLAWFLRFNKGTPIAASRGEFIAQSISLSSSLGWLMFVALFGYLSVSLGRDVAFLDLPTPGFVVLSMIGLVSAGLTVATVVGLWPVWRGKGWSFMKKTRYSLSAAVMVFGLIVLNHWNIVPMVL